LKALIVDRDIEIPRTHNILDLNNAAKKLGYAVEVTDEDAVFLNSIYCA
jgi:HEPN domain-containing protein